MEHESLLAQLQAMRLESESAMLEHAGDTSVCQIHKDGQVTGGLKYQEGRLVAVSDAMRQIKAQQQADVDAIVLAQLEKWQAQLTRHQTQAQPALSWVAYAQGGVDALEAIRAWRLPE